MTWYITLRASHEDTRFAAVEYYANCMTCFGGECATARCHLGLTPPRGAEQAELFEGGGK